ncbi:acylamino-acid-releasing enzyme [Aplysia californica]|uniref:Prolyl endopeptidase n=1 Tax=Aplysia californica TaxID=6500 RepID=A0ABM0K923_APLCA|nr:acylamino-acid-releasing enzyme [Aplysia californica]
MVVLRQPKDIAAIYREVNSYPAVASATTSRDGNILLVNSTWSQRDLDRKEKGSFNRSHTIDLASGKVLSQDGPQEVKNELWNRISPSGKLRAVVRSGKDKKNEDKQYLEIFDNSRKLKTIDVLALERHGKIIGNDGQFGSFEWSSSEGHILYLAEKKLPKTGGFFDPKAYQDNSDDDDSGTSGGKSETVQRGDEFVYRETWGEQLLERVHPVICVLDIEASTVSVLENIPENVSPGQAMWAPDDAGVVACGWSHEPYRLGLKFCCQRKSFIYYLDIQKGSVEILSEEGRGVRFPRFSPDMSTLVYLDTPVGGPHNQCSRLIKIDWATQARSIVVDEVSNALASEFPGIFTYSVARSLWFDDNVHLALETSWRSSSAVIIINTKSQEVRRLRKETEKGSMNLLCVENGVLALTCSSPCEPFHLVLAQVPDLSDLSQVKWVYPDGEPSSLAWLDWSVLTHKPSSDRVNPKYASLDYESILCLPKQTNKDVQPPLIVFSHGGPNSVFDTSFVMATNFFCRCGFAVVMVNYRGSIGFGQDSVLSLAGNIGTQDVKDVESAMVDVIAKGVVDGDHLFAFGGSHGGFLTTHLIGQYPDTFKGAATRNPVINLSSKSNGADNPETTFAQMGIEFDYNSLCDDKVLNKLWKASPLSYVEQVKTPILMMIGLEDKRVPISQGIEYYRALRSRGVPIRYLTYPGNNHSIAEVDAEADCMMNTVLWFAARC